MNFFSRKNVEPHRKPFDVNDLEADIVEELQRQRSEFAPPPKLLPVANEEIARITGDVIKASHEQAAAALGLLGRDLEERVNKINLLKIDAEETLKSCRDLMNKYRDKGLKDAALIETTSRLNEEARDMIESMRKRLEQNTGEENGQTFSGRSAAIDD